MKIPNLLYSTVVLTVSNVFIRLLGFLYKIFLSNTMGTHFLGLFHLVFHFLTMCISITTTGIPVALSCLVSKEKALGNKNSMNNFLISTLYLSFIISIFISIIVILNSKFLSIKMLHSDKYQIIILLITPAVSLITISNILRGYFYGLKKVWICAIGQLLEQIFRILFVISLFLYIKNSNTYILIAILAISLGEIVNIFFITVNLINEHDFKMDHHVKFTDFLSNIKTIIKISFPITFNRIFVEFIKFFNSILIPKKLVLSGMSYNKALSMYGIISGMVFPFLFLPFVIISALVINLIPSLSQELPKKNYSLINKKINFSLALSLVIATLSFIFFILFGDNVCNFVYKNELAGRYLQILSIGGFFMILNHTLSGILHGIGKEYMSTFNNILGLLIELICIYTLVPIKNINIYGFIYGFILCNFVVCILHLITLYNEKKRWVY
ncbi:stage V sporulation protein B [Alkalithermobacter thermoalcaliphilus JW-YL-7 = DSM 7308]|uniref:Polysaccharide biosynthesis protein n=1 Tax=Alkalithermobacter thermoalcaliphilus JW-YL-7 = DSM 7308 TaxID=1121328 RepID=A0A150FRF1_CLOPD|nr:polysaccharide biosynthesis protein [[Clostridium] paradoxum JW-YL-7 = DSM 7308]SHK42984.1 stage V sporulation protein B [[Clostridium] paradoxum JW-YL-7 = DSM 7308]